MSEKRGAADLPTEALAVIREQGVAGLFVSFGLVGIAGMSWVLLGLCALYVATFTGANNLVIQDPFRVNAWDPLGMAGILVALAAPAALATSGPLVMAWHRRSGPYSGIAKLAVLLLPDVASFLILGEWADKGYRPFAYLDAPALRAAIAVVWLAGSAVVTPLVPAVVFFEKPAGLRAALRRANELARGRRGLVLLVKGVPLVAFAGGLFQVIAEGRVQSAATLSPQLAFVTMILGVLVMAASPVLVGLLGVAAYRIAVTSEE